MAAPVLKFPSSPEKSRPRKPALTAERAHAILQMAASTLDLLDEFERDLLNAAAAGKDWVQIRNGQPLIEGRNLLSRIEALRKNPGSLYLTRSPDRLAAGQ